MNDIRRVKDAKRLFVKHGACSSTVYFILSREFGHQDMLGVRAAEPLAGGILRQGYECGMIWGSSLAVGAEAYRRFGASPETTGIIIEATQSLMKSFVNRTKSIDCYDITECDWTNKVSMMKYMLTGKFLSCFRLIDKWAPEAISTSHTALKLQGEKCPEPPLSCASEIAKKMGATAEQAAMVAGFAGGMGLQGSACGALGAAIWLKTIDWCRANPGKSSYNNPLANTLLEKFQKATDHKMLCPEITGKRISSIAEHTEFVRSGGCADLMKVFAG